ncbi:hypothetical protein C0Q70_05476 [Pomacea canaliculata]|uniref:Uncharacterized protein n=1 Tax=Pomacea canaliculata TaxID=400727 RepID=A0A2T7PLC4_POMCA|nr:hypothetical protein C0Q70_05476 [Pomacea canaliculata]
MAKRQPTSSRVLWFLPTPKTRCCRGGDEVFHGDVDVDTRGDNHPASCVPIHFTKPGNTHPASCHKEREESLVKRVSARDQHLAKRRSSKSIPTNDPYPCWFRNAQRHFVGRQTERESTPQIEELRLKCQLFAMPICIERMLQYTMIN